MKKVLRILLSLMLFLTFFTTLGVSGEAFENKTKIKQSISDYSDIISKYKDKDEFTATYGGAYINDDGILVMYFTEKASKELKDNILKNARQEMIIRESKYSYDDLNKLMKYLDNNKKLNELYDVVSYRVDERENKIILEIYKIDNKKLNKFVKEILDSPAIEIINTDDIGHDEASPVINGEIISSSSGSSTIGFPATRNGTNGFVIAAHGVGAVGDNITYNGSVVGTVRARYYANEVDAAFVEITNPNYYMSTKMTNSTFLSGYVFASLSPVGTPIYRHGGFSGRTSGTVTSNNATFYVNGVQFTNLSTSGYSSQSGDSGSPVTLQEKDSDTGGYPLIGIHKGASGSTRYYCRYEYIRLSTRLNVSMYIP